MFPVRVVNKMQNYRRTSVGDLYLMSSVLFIKISISCSNIVTLTSNKNMKLRAQPTFLGYLSLFLHHYSDLKLHNFFYLTLGINGIYQKLNIFIPVILAFTPSCTLNFYIIESMFLSTMWFVGGKLYLQQYKLLAHPKYKIF